MDPVRIDKTFEELVDEFDALMRGKQLRKDRPWAFDIIRVLWGRPHGLTNQQLYREVRAIRDPSELPKPARFEETIRSALNGHTSQSTRWSGNPDDDLFFSPKGRGTWAVRHDAALNWIRKHDLAEP